MAASPSATPEPVHLSITSDLERIAEVRRAGERLALAIGFDEEDAKMIMLTIDEALANVIKHGYDGLPGQPIEITMEQLSESGRRGILIVVRDQARKVDPSSIKGRDLDDIRPGGLGVHLMRTVMDRVIHQPGERGMVLEMAKFLRAADVAP